MTKNNFTVLHLYIHKRMQPIPQYLRKRGFAKDQNLISLNCIDLMCKTSQQNRKPVSTAIKMYTLKSRDQGVGTLQLFCEPIQCGLCEYDFRDDHFISTNQGTPLSRGGTLCNPPPMLALLQSLFRPHVGSHIVEVLWMQFPCYFQGTILQLLKYFCHFFWEVCLSQEE